MKNVRQEKAISPLFINGFVLKILAFFFMTLDHLGFAFALSKNPMLAPLVEPFRDLGRIAFPLFMFMVSEGMAKSKRKGRYLLRVLAMYLLITIGETIAINIPYFASLGVSSRQLGGHAFTDILMNAAVLYFLYQKGWKKALAILPFGFILFSHIVSVQEDLGTYLENVFPMFLRSGYGLLGPALCLGFTLGLQGFKVFCSKKRLEMNPLLQQFLSNVFSCLGAIVLVAILAIPSCLLLKGYEYGRAFWIYESFGAFAFLLLLPYSGKRGYDALWWRIFSYFYFVLHLGVIFLLLALVF